MPTGLLAAQDGLAKRETALGSILTAVEAAKSPLAGLASSSPLTGGRQGLGNILTANGAAASANGAAASANGAAASAKGAAGTAKGAAGTANGAAASPLAGLAERSPLTGRQGLLPGQGFSTSPERFRAPRTPGVSDAIRNAPEPAGANGPPPAVVIPPPGERDSSGAGPVGVGGRSEEAAQAAVEGFGFVDAAINAAKAMSVIGIVDMLGGIVADPEDLTPSLIESVIDSLIESFTGDSDASTESVGAGDVDASPESQNAPGTGATPSGPASPDTPSGPAGGEGSDAAGAGQGSEGTGAAGTGAGNDAPGASAGAGGDPGQGGEGPDAPGAGGGEGGGGGGGGGGSCFAAGTPIDMAEGAAKPVEEIRVGDQTRGGEVTTTMVFSASGPIFNYRGVVVDGSHAVLEDGRWTRVKDADRAVQLTEVEAAKVDQLFVFDTTEHRIFTTGVTFADYSEVDDDSEALAAIDTILLGSLQAQQIAQHERSINA